MNVSRRNFLILSATAVEASAAAWPAGASGEQPWYATMRRCGQTNFNERDPIELNIEEWIEYWLSLKLDALLLNGGGIMAFYPTRIPFHHRSAFLGSRDLFGDFTKAAKQAGLRVVARMDCNYVYREAYEAHPEWVERNADGTPVLHGESPWLYKTCMYSTYFTEQMPAIIREINSLYDVDGFFTNGWPSTGRPPACHCDACRALGDVRSPQYFEAHQARVLEIWKLWDGIAKEKKWDSVYVGNLGGGIHAITDIHAIAGVAGWFNADHQGRNGATPIWDCAAQGRAAQSVMKGRTITNVTGAYANTNPLWRHTSKAPQEATMWMAQTTASGMTPWYHWLGGAAQDLRWRETGRAFYQWLAANERHFVNRGSIANLAVVFSQRTNGFYKPPGGTDAAESLQGLYYALLEGRYCFDFVHEQDLGPARLKKYDALLLPNTACLSDSQCAQLRAYAAAGGSLLATFESSRYDEWGRRRDRLGLGDVFGVEESGEVAGPDGNAFYAHIEAPHEILRGFKDTTLLPGAGYRLPVRSAQPMILSVIPPYPAYPPEMVYSRADPRAEKEPAVVLREQGRGRTAWFCGDIARSFWRTDNGDLSLLLRNSIDWLLRGRRPVAVEGAGMAEVFAWETEPGYAVHILNYNNPNMLRGWFRRTSPIGPQRMRLAMPASTNVREVRALRAGMTLTHRQDGNTVEFTVPRVNDYEVAAVVIHG